MSVPGVIATAGAAVIVLLVQTTLLPHVQPMIGVIPNLVLVLAVYLGLRHPGALGACAVFVLGYFLDTFAGTTLGFHTLGLVVVFAVAAALSGTVRSDGGGPLVVVVFAAGCLETLVSAGLFALELGGQAPWFDVLRYGMGQAAAAALLAPLVLRLVMAAERLLDVD
jgi:rod shape-determining protein MreD